MFEHFTFGASVQPQSLCDLDDVAASPRDMSSIAPAVQLPESVPTTFDESPMNDILCRLTHQSLEAEDCEMPIRWTEHLDCSAAEKSYGEDHELSYISSRRGRTILRSAQSMKSTTATCSRPKSSLPCKRQLRQLNTQLQSCTSHVKDISTLVEDMITSNTQCIVSAAPSITTAPSSPNLRPVLEVSHPPNPISPSPTSQTDLLHQQILEVDDDEGFSELDDNDALELLLRERQVSLSRHSRHNSFIQDDEEHETSLPSSSYSYPSISSSSSATGLRKFSVMRYGAYKSFSYSPSDGECAPADDVNNYMPRDAGRGMVLCKPRMRLRLEDEEKRRRRKKEKRDRRKAEDMQQQQQ